VRPPNRNSDARGQVLFDATCRHRRPITPYMAGLTSCLHLVGGGSRSRGDTWRPRSCPESGGRCWSPGDMWRPRNCPELGGGSRSRGNTWHPRSCPASGGGCWSPGDMWHPRSCPEPGGGNRSHGDTWRPGATHLSRPFVGGQGMVVPVTPPDNPH
jgi:hypothetical protein